MWGPSVHLVSISFVFVVVFIYEVYCTVVGELAEKLATNSVEKLLSLWSFQALAGGHRPGHSF